ncbi:MAG: O-antigen ligase family protein [Chloroflexota bacterium]
MIETSLNSQFTATADDIAKRRTILVWRNLIYVILAGGIGAAILFSTTVDWPALAWALFLIAIAAIFYEPRYGLYAIMFFGMVGDIVVSSYLPFDKNLSSVESIFFLHDSAAISPVEIMFGLTTVSWILRLIMRRELNKIKYGGIFWALTAFLSFMTISLVYGVLRRGDIFIAQFEYRPFIYLFVLYVLTRNLIESPKQINILFWCVMSALFIEGILAYVFVVTQVFEVRDELTEHSASIHYNTMYIMWFASWVVRNGSWYKRFFLLALFPPVIYSFIKSDRRSAMLAVIIAAGLCCLYLIQERNLLFKILVPTGIVFGLAYLGLFWNSTSSLAKPVQAIKSVVAPGEISEKDQSSNYYRFLENANTHFTISQVPLFGVGLGNKFLRIVEMTDISFFIFWEYITHNSVLWIWMQAGLFGFLSMIYFIGLGIMKGARVAWNLPSSEIKVFAMVCATYLVMHFIYAYVDISWTSQSMLYVGVALGLIAIFEDYEERLANGETIEDLYAIKA